MNEPYLNITPLGGLGEIGLNCQLWETAGGVVMVDCGYHVLGMPQPENI